MAVVDLTLLRAKRITTFSKVSGIRANCRPPKPSVYQKTPSTSASPSRTRRRPSLILSTATVVASIVIPCSFVISLWNLTSILVRIRTTKRWLSPRLIRRIRMQESMETQSTKRRGRSSLTWCDPPISIWARSCLSIIDLRLEGLSEMPQVLLLAFRKRDLSSRPRVPQRWSTPSLFPLEITSPEVSDHSRQSTKSSLNGFSRRLLPSDIKELTNRLSF